MTKVSLLIEDSYIEEFMKQLPKGKVIVIEENFETNKKLLESVLNQYEENKEEFVPYYESMKNISTWFKEQEVK